jgi:hypothetical protein
MPIVFQVVFVSIAIIFSTIGLWMLFAPNRYPKLYEGFLSATVMRRQHSEKDRTMAIRTQGLIGISCGAFFGFFVWALR